VVTTEGRFPCPPRRFDNLAAVNHNQHTFLTFSRSRHPSEWPFWKSFFLSIQITDGGIRMLFSPSRFLATCAHASRGISSHLGQLSPPNQNTSRTRISRSSKLTKKLLQAITRKILAPISSQGCIGSPIHTVQKPGTDLLRLINDQSDENSREARAPRYDAVPCMTCINIITVTSLWREFSVRLVVDQS